MDASDRTRRCIALALAEMVRHPDPQWAAALEQLRLDFVALRGGILASNLDPQTAQRQMVRLNALAEQLLRDVTARPSLIVPEEPAQESAQASS